VKSSTRQRSLEFATDDDEGTRKLQGTTRVGLVDRHDGEIGL